MARHMPIAFFISEKGLPKSWLPSSIKPVIMKLYWNNEINNLAGVNNTGIIGADIVYKCHTQWNTAFNKTTQDDLKNILMEAMGKAKVLLSQSSFIPRVIPETIKLINQFSDSELVNFVKTVVSEKVNWISDKIIFDDDDSKIDCFFSIKYDTPCKNDNKHQLKDRLIFLLKENPEINDFIVEKLLARMPDSWSNNSCDIQAHLFFNFITNKKTLEKEKKEKVAKHILLSNTIKSSNKQLNTLLSYLFKDHEIASDLIEFIFLQMFNDKTKNLTNIFGGQNTAHIALTEKMLDIIKMIPKDIWVEHEDDIYRLRHEKSHKKRTVLSKESRIYYYLKNMEDCRSAMVEDEKLTWIKKYNVNDSHLDQWIAALQEILLDLELENKLPTQDKNFSLNKKSLNKINKKVRI